MRALYAGSPELRNNRAQLKVNVHLNRESREYTPALGVNAYIPPRVTL